MDLSSILGTILGQLQSPTLAFLIGGLLLGAMNSKLRVPDSAHQIIVLILLLKVRLSAGIGIRSVGLSALVLPAIGAAVVGVAIVLLGTITLVRLNGVSKPDAYATVGLFSAFLASTLAAGMAVMDDTGVTYEGYIGALYPFMDLAALLTAVILARTSLARAAQTSGGTVTMGGSSLASTLKAFSSTPCGHLQSPPFSSAFRLDSLPSHAASTKASMSHSSEAFFP